MSWTLEERCDPKNYWPQAQERKEREGLYIEHDGKKIGRFGLGASCPECHKSLPLDRSLESEPDVFEHLCHCGGFITPDEVYIAHGLEHLLEAGRNRRTRTVGV